MPITTETLKIRRVEYFVEFHLIDSTRTVIKRHSIAEMNFWGNKKIILASIIEDLCKELQSAKILDEFHDRSRKLTKSQQRSLELLAGRTSRETEKVKRKEIVIPDDGYLC